MTYEVYINDELIELSGADNIGLTFQVFSIFNSESRNGFYSSPIKASKTKINNIIFENLSNVNSSTNLPYIKNRAKIIQNGVEIVPNGFAIIVETNDSYNFNVFSGNSNFFDLIKGLNVNQIDWSDLIHEYKISDIISSFSNTNGFTYPIIDYGNGTELLTNTITQNADALFLALFVKDVLERSSSEQGYSLTGTFTDSEQYDKQLITINQWAYPESATLPNTGYVDTVGVEGDTVFVEGSDSATGGDVITNIPLVYSFNNWANYSSGVYTADNYYRGVFELNVQGTISGDPPEPINNIINQGNRSYDNANINDTHVVYTRQRNGFTETVVYLYEIATGLTTQITSLGSGGASGITSITEDTGGYIAWSVKEVGALKVNIYEIATATTTTIHNNTSGGGIASFLKIYNGKVTFRDNTYAGGGLFCYDIATATKKTVTTNTIQANIDSIGTYVTYVDSSVNHVKMWDYATATTTTVKNQGTFSGVNTLKILGDYITYWDTIIQRFESYKISTTTLNTIITGAANEIVSGSTRTATSVVFSTRTTKEVYLYDLSTSSLTSIGESTASVTNDNSITSNANYVAYNSFVNNQWQLRCYNISTGVFSVIDSGYNDFDNMIISTSDILVYHDGISNVLKRYNCNNGVLLSSIGGVRFLRSFIKAKDTDRIVYTNDNGTGASSLDRVAFLNATSENVDVYLELVIQEDGIDTYSTTVVYNGDFNTTFNITLNSGSVIVKNGSEYESILRLICERDETIDYNVTYALSSTSHFKFSPEKYIPYNATINPSILYDWKQSDVWKDVMNQYCLVLQTNDVTRKLSLNYLNDLSSNISKARNWSSKIVKGTISVKYEASNYAQTNYMRYAADDDVPVEKGVGKFNVLDENIEPSKDIIIHKSAAVEDGLRMLNKSVNTIPFITSVGSMFDKKKSRFVLLDKQNTTLNLKTSVNSETGTTSVNIPFTYFEKSSKNDSLDGQSLLNENYSTLRGMLDGYKNINAKIRLTELDVVDFDFTIPIYIEYNDGNTSVSGYFYVNKISNFKRNLDTSIELIRL